MVYSAKDIDFSNLSVAERIQLVQDLWDRVHADDEDIHFTAEQVQELERRIAEHASGRMPTYSWDEVKQRLMDRK
jgi:putative addiction module component (TIGR02574 family)